VFFYIIYRKIDFTKFANVLKITPLAYIEFLYRCSNIIARAFYVITDFMKLRLNIKVDSSDIAVILISLKSFTWPKMLNMQVETE
jgi:hypothetical protein